MTNMNTSNKIDFSQIYQKLWSNKFLFIKIWVITFVLSCLWIFPQPRYYTCSVSIAPESSDTKGGGSLTSLAASFGLNLGSMSSSDAIYPQLYPELFKSTDFIVDFFDIKVTSVDGKINTDYYTYITQHQKANPYTVPLTWVKDNIKALLGEEKPQDIPGRDGKRFDPFRLSITADKAKEFVQGSIKCTYSKTTDIVTIEVRDQDPLICATLADSAMAHLQNFIVEYRTKKSIIDYEYYKDLAEEAKQEYEDVRISYSTFVDKHSMMHLASHTTKQLALESEMQVKQQLYNIMTTRMEEARGKIQENTPAFTTLKSATVPVLPAGPKRMFFCATMLLLSTLGVAIYLLRKELQEWF